MPLVSSKSKNQGNESSIKGVASADNWICSEKKLRIKVFGNKWHHIPKNSFYAIEYLLSKNGNFNITETVQKFDAFRALSAEKGKPLCSLH